MCAHMAELEIASRVVEGLEPTAYVDVFNKLQYYISSYRTANQPNKSAECQKLLDKLTIMYPDAPKLSAEIFKDYDKIKKEWGVD